MLDWQLLDQDWDSAVRNAVAVASALEDHYAAVSWMSINLREPWPWGPTGPVHGAFSSWGFHHMGTTRMSDDIAAGVVDRDCRVHGTANLYVAGSSVFPTGSAANPTFMIVALAHRLGEHLSATKLSRPGRLAAPLR